MAFVCRPPSRFASTPAATFVLRCSSRPKRLGVVLGSRLVAKSPKPNGAVKPQTRRGTMRTCNAAEGQVDSVQSEAAEEGWGRTLLLGSLFAGWYAANVLFNIFNKTVLKEYPCPITCTCIQVNEFGVGAVMVLLAWATRLIKVPRMNKDTWLAILPLAVVHTLGNSFTNISLGQVAVSFTHTIKAMEPFFSVILSAIFLNENPTLPVLLCLFPIVGGVVMASISEVSFTWSGFLSAMGSNLTFQSRNVLSKKTMGSSKLDLDNISLFSLITIASFFLLLPFAFLVEGDLYSSVMMKSMGVLKPEVLIGRALLAGVFFHLYQQVSYMILQRVSPVTHSVGNCIKRVIIIVAAVIFFKNPMPIQSQIGTGVALLGVFFYSQAKRMGKKKVA